MGRTRMGRTDGRTDGLTDGRTDGRTDGQGDDYMLPRNFSGSIKKVRTWPRCSDCTDTRERGTPDPPCLAVLLDDTAGRVLAAVFTVARTRRGGNASSGYNIVGCLHNAGMFV